MKIVPASTWTMDKKVSKRIKIAAIDDKRMITAVFANSLSGKFLPIQLVYKGTTQNCLPKNVSFLKDWHITYSANHWSNEITMIAYLNHIIIPYINAKRKELSRNQEHPALAIFDVFKGQCTENVFQLLEENNILYVIVPNNCTDVLQPLDLSINKPAKHFMKSKFQEWYGNIICKQLEDQVDEEVDLV